MNNTEKYLIQLVDCFPKPSMNLTAEFLSDLIRVEESNIYRFIDNHSWSYFDLFETMEPIYLVSDATYSTIHECVETFDKEDNTYFTSRFRHNFWNWLKNNQLEEEIPLLLTSITDNSFRCDLSSNTYNITITDNDFLIRKQDDYSKPLFISEHNYLLPLKNEIEMLDALEKIYYIIHERGEILNLWYKCNIDSQYNLQDNLYSYVYEMDNGEYWLFKYKLGQKEPFIVMKTSKYADTGSDADIQILLDPDTGEILSEERNNANSNNNSNNISKENTHFKFDMSDFCSFLEKYELPEFKPQEHPIAIFNATIRALQESKSFEECISEAMFSNGLTEKAKKCLFGHFEELMEEINRYQQI